MSFIAKKKFGQNFLVNPALQAKFVAVASRILEQNQSITTIVEMGPGQGHLTSGLVNLDAQIFAFDIDPESIDLLAKTLNEHTNLHIEQQDLLQTLPTLAQIIGTENFLFFSNLPYNVGSRIIMDLAVYYPTSPFIVGMQKEVTGRMNTSKPINLLGAWINLIYSIKPEFDIAPGNFVPAPNVMSTVIKGQPVSSLPSWLGTVDKRLHARLLLKKLFAFPSKTIGNNLKPLYQGLPVPNQLESLLPQRLTWANYRQVLETVVHDQALKQ